MAQKHNQNETQNAPMTRLGNLQLNAQQRIIRGTAFLSTSFSANNPILQLGELGYETDTNKLKIGDGVTAWNDLAYVGGGSDTSASLAQFDTMPTASADNLGDIVQYVGETDANYTNGYIYQCTGAGEPVVYSWTQIDVQPAPEALPDQTGHSGEFLTTDGTDASWAAVNALPNQTGQSGKFLTTDGTDASWSDKPLVNNTTSSNSLAIGNSATATTGNSVVVGAGAYVNGGFGSTVIVGYNSSATSEGTAIGQHTQANQTGCIAIGNNASSIAIRAIQIGSGSNSESGTLCVGLYHNGQFPNYKLLDSDGTIPAARHASLPAADGTYVLKLVIASGVPTLSWVAE